MLLRNLDDARALFCGVEGTVVGVGMTAFSRIVPSHFLNHYCIVALRKTRDLPMVRKRARVFCLEEAVGKPIVEKGFNSGHLLAQPCVRRFLEGLPDPKHLLLYKSYPGLERMAEEEGWRLLSNPSHIRRRVGDRQFLRERIRDLGLPEIPGGIHPIGALHQRSYEDWAQALGPKLVFQLPELDVGGGKGTFFIRSPSEYAALQGRLKRHTWRDVHLERLCVHRYMEGLPASLALCVTGQGLLVSGLQRQLIDLPYCRDVLEEGVFCGHTWGEKAWPEEITVAAQGQGRTIGRVLAEMGYRGIFGVDFIVQEGSGRVYPLEINPRMTGAFPMLSLIHLRHGVLPLDIFHLLEFMGKDYRIDLEALHTAYRRPMEGSHLLVFRLSGSPGSPGRPGGALRAGLYRCDARRREIHFLQEALDYTHIVGEDQFIVADGPPDTLAGGPSSGDPLDRLCRLLFKGAVSARDGSVLDRALFAVNWVRDCILNETVGPRP